MHIVDDGKKTHHRGLSRSTRTGRGPASLYQDAYGGSFSTAIGLNRSGQCRNAAFGCAATVVDTELVIVKSDNAISRELQQELKEGVKIPKDVTRDPERLGARLE
ncbi:hypothetical protein QBC35DRAFT_448581 [Podospora australis]|uniref:Uncharacterized protein n=1 Tax=Podospora australis TaxID=1536484 RepID=A0AAN6X0Z4_9PEZI|nr:hypothetical protein QBC35DRAFT_448581 [Podospora australis]